MIGSSGCAGTFNCSDFEDGLGVVSGSGQIDNTIGYNSSSSVRMNTGQEFLEIDIPSSNFWARVFIRGGVGPNNENAFSLAHGTLLRARDGGRQMRVGDHRCQLEINRDGGDWDDFEMTSGFYGVDPCQQTFGARMKPDIWYCLEAHFDGQNSEIQVFWDNQNVEQLHVTAERIVTNADKHDGQYGDPNRLWGPSNYTVLQFGHETYFGNDSNTFWYDNVATSLDRIGCGSDYQINLPLDDSTRYPGYAEEEGLLGN